jgi:hypothetical protein
MIQTAAGHRSRLLPALLLLGILLAGCAVHSAHDRGTVSTDVRDRTGHLRGDLGRAAREIETRAGGLPFDREYHPEFLGEYAARSAASRRLIFLSALSLLGILLVLS